MNFTIIPKLRELSSKLYVIVDNTWVTSACFNPLTHGADIVISSMSKHYSGGECIGGFIISPLDFSKNLLNYIKINGDHVSLPYCD